MTKGIDRKYPVCIDCHGNHDVGNPPAEFSLNNVCTDCHKQFATDMPQAAALVAENDRLWQVLRKVEAKSKKLDDPIPRPYRQEVDRVRTLTARLMHRGGRITDQEGRTVNERAERLRESLEAWLKDRK